jgi:hypothetical protein
VLPNSSGTPRRALFIARRLALTLAIIATLLAAPATWGASGACSGPAHDPVLSAGAASPATGTTATTFTFSVTYADTKGCAPAWVRVTVVGAGTFSMNGAGTDYDTGVTFTRAMTLPAGTHAYSFAASSGIGSGLKTTTLTSVSPAAVTVTGPTPQPTPVPTPVPTPKPTPRPTSVPTPVPTSPPTPEPTPGASGSIVSPAASPSDGTASPSGAGASHGEGQAPGPSGDPPASPGSFWAPDGMSSLTLLLGAWATATVGGLALFLFLAPRRRQRHQPAYADAGPAEPAMASQPSRPPGEAEVTASLVPPDEANLPRWLRPSVQAARHEERGSRGSGTRRLGDS